MIYTIAEKYDKDTVGSIFSFDSISSIDEAHSSTISSQTVEKGTEVTDHINIEPTTYSIDAIITSYSLFDKGTEIIWDGEQFIGGFSEGDSHIKARDALVSLFKRAQILTLIESSQNSNAEDAQVRYKELTVGYVKEIDNLVMTSLSISNISSGSGAFLVAIKLQQINIAYIDKSELQEGEMLPALIGLNKVESSGGNSNKKDSETEDGSPPANLSMEDAPVEDIPKDGNWHEMYATGYRTVQLIKDEYKANELMNQYIKANNVVCRIEPVSGGWARFCKY